MGGYDWQMRADVIAFLGLFAGLVTLLRLLHEKLQPIDLMVEGKVYDAVRWLCGIGSGYVVGCMLAVSLHLAPLPREYAGFSPESPTLLGTLWPDMHWLGYAHRMSSGPYATTDEFGQPAMFDGNAYKLVKSPTVQAGIYPDFPIRYAARRAAYEGGAPAQAARRPTLGPPDPNKAPTGGKGF